MDLRHFSQTCIKLDIYFFFKTFAYLLNHTHLGCFLFYIMNLSVQSNLDNIISKLKLLEIYVNSMLKHSILFGSNFIKQILLLNKFLKLIMKEGTRLDYIVPGYTGHIPKKIYPDFHPVEKQIPRYQIPGYAGYVPAIKPQNLHAKTFGKLTYNISTGDYLKGQDHPVQHKYVSTHTNMHIPPTSMLQRTAADIVGVPPKKIEVVQPNLEKKTGPEVDQFTQTKLWKQSGTDFNKSSNFQNNTIINKNGKNYVELGEPLPGYTGFNKRILANNLFGKTYAESRKDAKDNHQKVQQNRVKNYHNQINSHPPIKY